MNRIALLAVAAVAPLALATAAQAQIKTSSGSRDGLTWSAHNTIIGATSTGGATGGGNPIFYANQPKYNGVVTLIMQYDDGSAFICTGSLISGNSIATAGHCVSDGYGTKGPARVRAYFSDSLDPDLRRFDPANNFDAVPGAVAIDVSRVYVNPGYTGEVIDQNDIAILRLETAAPDYAKVYDLYTSGLKGEQFNVVGNGRRSDGGGTVGANQGTGRLRQGENIYDYAWGDSAFGGFFTDIVDGENFFGTAEVQYSYISDFDSGLQSNNAACLIAAAVGAPGVGCNLGVGALEVGIAGGDSGGPGFVDGKLASINSYGLTFGASFGDPYFGFNPDGSRNYLNSSFGEFSGYVPIYLHESWIGGVVPEPATWAMMIAGFGLVGGALRRRRAELTA